ncbi:MAG: VOC family protein, partial [Pseudomonadota bacterium]
AKPYNLGVSVLRYPVADLDATMAAITQRGGRFISDVHMLELAPYGTVKAIAMAAPDGGRIEIYQVITG